MNNFQYFLKKYILSKKLKKLGSYGKHCDIQHDIQLFFPERIILSNYIYIGPNANLNGLGGIEIKSGTIIGPNVFIHSANHRYKNAEYLPNDEKQDYKKVTIGENVWIGGNVSITPGTSIGEGCIIGMGSVVSGTIPALSIVVGNPCRIISQRDTEHYNRLKKNNKIYLIQKFNYKITPDYYSGFDDFTERKS